MQPLADLINDKKTDSSDLQPVPLKVLWIIFCKVCCHLFGTTIKIAPESEKKGKGFDDSMALSYILYHFIQWYANDMPSTSSSNPVAPAKNTQKLPSVRPPWDGYEFCRSLLPTPRLPFVRKQGLHTHLGRVCWSDSSKPGLKLNGFQERMAMHSILNGNMSKQKTSTSRVWTEIIQKCDDTSSCTFQVEDNFATHCWQHV